MDDVKGKLQVMMVSVSLVAAVAVGFALHWLQPVMIPLVLAVLLMYGLAPLVDWIMARGRVGKGVAILVALLFSEWLARRARRTAGRQRRDWGCRLVIGEQRGGNRGCQRQPQLHLCDQWR